MVKRYVQVSFSAEKILLLSSILVITFFLYFLRPYIGFAFMSALLFYELYSFKRYPLLLSVICYLLALNALSMIGVFDNILQYRSYFISEVTGGSNLNISFDSPMMFIPSFVTSFTFQMLGVFFVNVSATLVFFVESVPFIIAFYYLIKNRKFSNEFVDYLVVFFVVYSTIWLLGNDNLGTAVRLRMFSYLSIFIACMIVYQNKLIYLNKIKQA